MDIDQIRITEKNKIHTDLRLIEKNIEVATNNIDYRKKY